MLWPLPIQILNTDARYAVIHSVHLQVNISLMESKNIMKSRSYEMNDTCSTCYRNSTAYTQWSETRSSADADNGLDAFSSQSRSTNIVPFHMLHIVSHCAIVILSLKRAVFTIFDFKKYRHLQMGVKDHSRSLRVVSFDRLCMVSY